MCLETESQCLQQFPEVSVTAPHAEQPPESTGRFLREVPHRQSISSAPGCQGLVVSARHICPGRDL